MYVEVFTGPSCPYCHPTVETIRKLAPDAEVTEISVSDENGQYRAKSMGVMCLPTILINGKVVSRGKPSDEKLRKLLNTTKE